MAGYCRHCGNYSPDYLHVGICQDCLHAHQKGVEDEYIKMMQETGHWPQPKPKRTPWVTFIFMAIVMLSIYFCCGGTIF